MYYFYRIVLIHNNTTYYIRKAKKPDRIWATTNINLATKFEYPPIDIVKQISNMDVLTLWSGDKITGPFDPDWRKMYW